MNLKGVRNIVNASVYSISIRKYFSKSKYSMKKIIASNLKLQYTNNYFWTDSGIPRD